VRARALLVPLVLLALLASAARGQPPSARPAPPIVVASKPFAESYLLAELFAQLLEARGLRVDRRPGLGATEVAFAAVRADAVDVYPEYTGTGLLAVLGDSLTDSLRADPRAVYARVARASAERWGVRWLPPLGFENTYAVAVRRETARRYRLATLTDLARAAPALRGGFTADFIGRPDGLPGLSAAYALTPAEVRPLAPGLKYQALAAGAVDVIDGYSTDGLLERYDLVTLVDDRRFFPPYEAAAVVGPRAARERPEVVAALALLSGRLDERRMRALNRRVEVDGEEVRVVAADALRALGLAPARRRHRPRARAPAPRGCRATSGSAARRSVRSPCATSRSPPRPSRRRCSSRCRSASPSSARAAPPRGCSARSAWCRRCRASPSSPS
jgi:glycine betaine/choline ABC-type transport system substrate-binding protein